LGWSAGSNPFAAIFVALPVSSETFIYVFLPLLVFEAGIVTDVRRTLEDAAPILLLAIVATLITTAVIGLALWPLAGVPLVVCLLLGAVVATTDPAAVIAIFRDVGAPARLTRLVEGEALLNDAAAISLFAVLLGTIVSALGRSRIAPYNWSFLTDLWDQIAFWARSLVFILASILVPRLLGDVGLHDLMLVAMLVVAAFAARILVLFVLVPPLEFFKF